jgi:hypothetical protein
MIRELGRQIKEAAGSVTSRSIMNPLLWLCAILALPALIASVFSAEPYKFYLFACFVVMGAVAIGSYIFFAIFDRDRLQDEEYRLRDKALTIFGDSSSDPASMDRIIHGTPMTPQMIDVTPGRNKDDA